MKKTNNTTPTVFDLECRDTRKSFYWKAKVIDNWKEYLLKSYDTIVASYDNLTKQVKVNWWYSNTTLRHINSFLKYLWFSTVTKKEIENWLYA